MKRLMMTSALVLTTALPMTAFADSHSASEMATSGMIESKGMDGTMMQIKASNLIGHSLYMPEDKTAMNDDIFADLTEAPDTWVMTGDISDVVMTKDGEVKALLIDAGGFLGMGETDRRIDLNQVSFHPDMDDEGEFFAVYTGDRAMFEETSMWSDDDNDEGYMRATQTGRDEYKMNMTDVSYDGVNTEDLLGVRVYGGNGNWVGDLSELSLSDDGKIDAVILDIGGFLGIGEHAVRMPMDKVQLRRTDDDDLRAYVNATEEELEAMEEWSVDNS